MLRVQLVGNLGKTPMMTTTSKGIAVTNFSVACNKGSQDSSPTWIDVSCWESLAITTNKNLVKGSKVFIEGRLSVNSYVNKNEEVKVNIRVIADEVQLLTHVEESIVSEFTKMGRSIVDRVFGTKNRWIN